ncbi:hypothetical protein [Desertihabitans brevis]|uniref:hypothetical protein n=1 Tax=Desertihabitans brevis TaxID=2268447 RepID=UPI001314D1D8|nr:hypothetical protein [Desertihabitans brevis]
MKRAESRSGDRTADVIAEAPKLGVSGDAATLEVGSQDLEISFGRVSAPSVTREGEHSTVDGGDTDYVVDALDESTTRFSAVMKHGAANPSWTLAGDFELLPIADGRVSVLDADGEVVLGIEAPWAVDAAGEAIPTRYAVDGRTLTQVVETDASTEFPVVADPTFKVLPGYVRVGFSRSESFSAVGSVASCTALLSKSPHPVGKALAVGCGALAAYSGAQLAGGKCLSIKVVGVPPAITWWPSFPQC